MLVVGATSQVSCARSSGCRLLSPTWCVFDPMGWSTARHEDDASGEPMAGGSQLRRRYPHAELGRSIITSAAWQQSCRDVEEATDPRKAGRPAPSVRKFRVDPRTSRQQAVRSSFGVVRPARLHKWENGVSAMHRSVPRRPRPSPAQGRIGTTGTFGPWAAVGGPLQLVGAALDRGAYRIQSCSSQEYLLRHESSRQQRRRRCGWICGPRGHAGRLYKSPKVGSGRVGCCREVARRTTRARDGVVVRAKGRSLLPADCPAGVQQLFVDAGAAMSHTDAAEKLRLNVRHGTQQQPPLDSEHHGAQHLLISPSYLHLGPPS
jgi:hypothetical protein